MDIVDQVVTFPPSITGRLIQICFTDYHNISGEALLATGMARNNPRAKQVTWTVLTCIQKSMTGDLSIQIFGTIENIPNHTDGPTLFKQITKLTVIASLQLSITATAQILLHSKDQH